jgi:uncharacterized repeat protein (TIGR02543 family)
MITRKYTGALLIVCLIAGSAFATNTWTASTGSWGTPPGGADADWSAGIVPAATEQVKIGSGYTCTVDVTTCVMGTQKLTIGTTATEAALNIISGGILNAGAEIQIGDTGGIQGRITQTSGTVNLVNGTASAKLEVGYKTGVGYYTISGGSIVGDATYSQLQVGASGANGGTGTFTVQGTGGSISISKLYVGASTASAQYTGTGILAFEINGGVSAINAGSVYIDPTSLVAALAVLNVTKTGALPTNDIILINNTGTNSVTGAFDNKAWGSTITLGGVNYTLTNTYIGGLDGIANDVAIIPDMNMFTFTLAYTADANGSIIGTTPQTVNYHTDGTAVTAQPALGYHFVEWSDDSTANPRTDVNVAADIAVQAEFAIDTFTLTYTAGANGSITGTTPQTVGYGSDSTAVTAQPAPGYHFVKWSDDSTANPRTDVNVTADITVTAGFAIDTFTLTYTADANGSITGTTPQTVDYGTDGAAVTAQPAPHYHFVKWSDDSTANPRTDVNVTADITVTAGFAIDTFALTYTADANGSITGTTPQTVDYGSNGSEVTAVPAPGYHFVKWSDDSTANPRTDLSVTSNISVTAGFAIDTFTLTYTADANGSITGTTPQTVDYGTDGTAVTAQPDPCYHFVKWSDDSTANPRTDVNVTADITVQAIFATGTFTLVYSAGANGSIIGTTPQTVNSGFDGTEVTAQPAPGYHFVKWSDDSTANPRTDVNVAADITVTAGFAIDNTVIAGKCKVAAGRTQYTGDSDFNDMKDSFTASGTITVLPGDLNTIDHIDVNIISADGNSIFFEANDFNYVRNVKKNVYTHKYKITKGNPTGGAITSMAINFSKKTFAVTVSSADLTGLACPLQLMISLGDLVLAGEVNEAIVNGKKIIPTRLMRLYKDTLIVTRASVKNSINPSSDSLSLKGDIAVEDMDLEANEPNLFNEDVVITWSDINDANVQTFTIPANSFTASKKGHIYKCSRINPDITPAEDVNTQVAATIDLDKCTFTISLKKADIEVASGAVKFGISFETPNAEFDESDQLSF